ncbi:hypothetical protein NP493_97g00004 [Ridgeia piscesae]|uniref:Laminin G domain-containing protein n=1 Tax=Ridgeia piscesae TaxID=27915 RepID=A0AAD9UHJ1_RIDPI|nr:hypothetical protein NP493_97g00004 [Ridgeia piscesae]
MSVFPCVLLTASCVLALHGVSDALNEITCLSFEKNCQGSRGVWVAHWNVDRVADDCPSGNGCGRFSRGTTYGSMLSIPRFAYSFSAWSSFTLSFWFKTNDAKTSLLFHNDLCQDHGSITVTLYNAGMLITELELEGGKTTMSAVFLSRNEWHHVAIVWTGSDVNTYVDAALKDTVPLSGARIYNTWCPLVIAGRPKNPEKNDDVVPYEGLMDQICMYGQGLTAEQVKEMYDHP